MGERTTAQMRTDMKVEIAKALRGALFDIRMTYEELAEVVGVCDTKVGNWCNPKSPELPCLASLALFPPALSLAILPLLMQGQGIAVAKREAPDPTVGDHFRRFGEVASKSTAAVSRYAKALEDGLVDAGEEREVRAALVELRNVTDAQVLALDAQVRALRSVRSA